MAAYALQLAGHTAKEEILQTHLGKVQTEGQLKWWEKSIEIECYYGKKSKTLNVEISSYGLMTLLQAGKQAEGLPILRWLLKQRNNKGGFEGTQDTIVGLEALAKYAELISAKNNNIEVTVKNAEASVDHAFTVNADNSLVLQSQRIPSTVQEVSVAATGSGFALVEVAYRYNTVANELKPGFLLKPKPTLKNSNYLQLEINTR